MPTSQPQRVPVVEAALLEGFAALLGQSGVRLDDLLEPAGLTPEQLQTGDPLPLNAVAKLFDLAARATGDPCFGIHFAKVYPFGGTGLVGYLFGNAPTPAAGIAVFQRYASLVISPITVDLRVENGLTHFTWRFPVTFTAPRLQYASFMAALVVFRLKSMAGEDWTPLAAEFEHRELGCPDDAAQVFGDRITYNAQRNLMLFNLSAISKPTGQGDTRLFSILSAHADMLLESESHSHGIADQTREQVVRLLREGSADLESVAGQLSLPVRTLQWRLDQEGTTFERILDDVRRSLSQHYLRDTDLSLTDIAFLLGFSEASAFSRAAGRWFHMPPRTWRQHAREGKLSP